MTEEKNCNNCSHCLVRVKFSPSTGREVGKTPVFYDANVRQIRCAKGVWEREFTLMPVFEISSLPREMAANCPYFDGEDEE